MAIAWSFMDRRSTDQSRGTHPQVANYVLEEQIGFILRQVHQRHSTLFARAIGANLTQTQWAALSKLAEVGACSQNQLGRMTAMDVATISGVIERLTGRGLTDTAQDPNDGRRVLVSLTRKGRELVDGATVNALAISDKTLAPLTAEERKTLIFILAKLR